MWSKARASAYLKKKTIFNRHRLESSYLTDAIKVSVDRYLFGLDFVSLN